MKRFNKKFGQKFSEKFSARDSLQQRSRKQQKPGTFSSPLYTAGSLAPHNRIFTINRLIYGVSVDFISFEFLSPDKNARWKQPKKNNETVIYEPIEKWFKIIPKEFRRLNNKINEIAQK